MESFLESPFGEPISRTTLEADYSMDSINQTPNKHPTIFQQASKRLEPVLNLETSFEDLFGELMQRALLEKWIQVETKSGGLISRNCLIWGPLYIWLRKICKLVKIKFFDPNACFESTECWESTGSPMVSPKELSK